MNSGRELKKADWILFNGKIVAVDKAFSIAEALAIGVGRFIKVGSNSEVCFLTDEKEGRVDLKGKTGGNLPSVIFTFKK